MFPGLGTRETNGSPLLTLRGTNDASNDLAACAEREEGLRGRGVEVEARVYEGAGHAWEIEKPRELMPSPYVAGCTVRYDERGRSFIGDTPIVSAAADDTRAERVLQRIASGGPMTECVHEGYVIGRDDEARARATRDWLDFLARTLEDGPA